MKVLSIREANALAMGGVKDVETQGRLVRLVLHDGSVMTGPSPWLLWEPRA